MPRFAESRCDVLVLGQHPCTYLAAALLRGKSPPARVVHVRLPEETAPDRLVTINPAFFALDPLLTPLRRKLDLTAVYGLRILADDPHTSGKHLDKSPLAWVGGYAQVRDALMEIARRSGAILLEPHAVEIQAPDETGVDVLLDGNASRAKALIVGGSLSEAQAKMLGMRDAWDRDVMYRYSFVKAGRLRCTAPESHALMAMSLDLKGQLHWAWLLPHGEVAQACVMQSLARKSVHAPADLVRHWVEILRGHGIDCRSEGPLLPEDIVSMDLPLAGALIHEGVADRTLLIGPGGGFYSAGAEDIYPNCWSAVFAVEVMKKALREHYLQDGLQHYRQKWGSTLGDYLRVPQQDLRFLLPLIYRNQPMATRLAESIFRGKSMVR